ncbi:Integrine FG-GAP repeat- and CAP domain-containing protein [Desulfonema magnum]|uniref:Integrine FG-GAP repeat- and CAP domain-containing protein n=2 Tax=Desulfonema magnum TaxID=45655 RepID=A0A975GK15_9BACT|nr:Integrine FG-GAP repeat- and CAP domain-containing protein [Desulfonema magnum]
MNGDYVIVGDDDGDAPGRITDSGCAYIFRHEGTEWLQQAKLTASDAAANESFGMSVSLSDEYAIVGSSYDDDGGTSSGAAYIFRREGTEWSQQVKLTADDPEAYDCFGSSVFLDGDYAVAGVPYDDDAGSGSGAVYIFKREGTEWNPQTKLTASDAEASAYFGKSVAISGGYAIVGAFYKDYNSHSGSAYIYPLATASITAQPEVIPPGGTSVLTWDTTHADSCVIEPDIGNADPNGSVEISMTETTTYTITATGTAGTGTDSVTVAVASAPTVSISAEPEIIQEGDSAVLTWSSTHADLCVIEPDIGNAVPNGSAEISPTETTTYTITATGLAGTVNKQITVIVTAPMPVVTISADPINIQPGQTSTLSWHSQNADTCVITPDVGDADLNGSVTVSPGETTTYTISATGLGLTATARVRVYVGDGNEYAYGDPSPAEQAHLEALNRARLDPHAEAERLGIELFEGVPEGEITEEPSQPLAFNARLYEAACLHSQDMIDRQYYAHNTPEGQTPSDRIEAAGYLYSTNGENIGYRASSEPLDETDAVLRKHDSLFIDAGVEGRGHRVNILNNDFKEVGLCAAHGSYGEYPYCHMFTCDFGASAENYDSFLTGVVYDDQNNDGVYTAGEGTENIEIVIAESGAVTRTASAGGYGIPLSPGDYTVKAVLPDGREAIREISIANRNVKLDFLLGDFGLQPCAVTIAADFQIISSGDSATLTWQSEHAYSVFIDNGVGYVPMSGSVTVSPAETTIYTVMVTGAAGTATSYVTICVDELPPPPSVEVSLTPELLGQGGTATLSWTSTDAEFAYIDNGVGEVPADGSLELQPDHTTIYTVTVVGPGGPASAEAVLMVAGSPEPQPEGSFGSQYEDLVPTNATVGSYDAKRFSIITGLVHNADGLPLADVSVMILGHPEYGTAFTGADGRFSIPAEGGSVMTLVYRKQGLLTSQRQAEVPWNDIAVAEAIQMIPEDPESSAVIFDGNPDTVATLRSSPVSDAFGTRSCTMVFRGDNP